MELKFPLLLDGATGTQLQKRGFGPGQCAEAWVLEHPEAIAEVQSRYAALGSQVVYAPTFGANRVNLEEHGIFGKVEEYNRRLVSISRQAVEGRALVAGDLSPTGKFLYPLGDMTFGELVEVYTQQAAALEAGGVDLFVIETMMTLSDARAALLAVKKVSRKPVLVTFTCDERGKTVSGVDAAAALVVMQAMGADAFGLNCSAGPREMLTNLRRLRPWAQVPLIAKPNAGLPEMVDGRAVYNCPPEEFISVLPQMAACGVCIFGGCCGTEEGHVEALAGALKQFALTPPQPEHEGMLVCASEKAAFALPPDTAVGPALACTAELEERLSDGAPETPVNLRIETEEDLQWLADCQYLLIGPTCFTCRDGAVLEQALLLYQGRALYEGPLPASVLEPLAQKYGLIY